MNFTLNLSLNSSHRLSFSKFQYLIICYFVCAVGASRKNQTVSNTKCLEELDRNIFNIVHEACSDQIKHLLYYMEVFANVLKLYNKQVSEGNMEIKDKVSKLMKKGGPNYFFQNNLFSSEKEFRNKINFSDFEYQEYLFLRAMAKDRWDSIVLKMKTLLVNIERLSNPINDGY